MTFFKKKPAAAAASSTSGDALGKDANIAMLLKERNANNAWHKLARNKTALVGFFIVAFMVILAVFAPLIAPYDPNAINPVLPFKGIGTPDISSEQTISDVTSYPVSSTAPAYP